ncbi:hypothetical protein Mvan_5771 [Mycolicibacterium vanbaalenii PYR-1]|uniref:Lipoprotein LpqB n=1 Tax=Mycolicibacterium vanbaalenii (strain DSM 7251 / JCM 13017 / BCRC 16820 / KCTC 9966 / NRRL B-24157 / PYR-1) TaxID=350058 RepID=A1TH86_MYCVP|nr:hypothetical protein Mvan_5771 [Mycolicibacterium vanbaalenii PYR-1]
MKMLQRNHRHRTRRTLVATLVLIAGLLAACSGLETSPGTTSATPTSSRSPFEPTTTPPPVPTGPLLAFRASDQLGIVDGTTVAASAPGTFEPSNDLIVTEDEKFVFSRTTDNHLVTLEVATGEATTRPVTVGPALGTAGGSTILWWEQPNRLMRLNLADPQAQPVLHQIVDLPPVAGVRPGEPRLLVARGGTAVVARVEAPPSPFGGPDTLYAVRGPGAPTSLGQADANSPVSVARLSPDGASLAYALYRSTDSACGTAAIVTSDADGTQQTFDVAGPDVNAGSRVTKLWWPQTGAPKLSLTTWQCGEPQTYPPVVWQVAGDQIAQITPPTSALQTAEVAAGQRALILPRSDAPGDPVGTLVLEESARRVSIASDVDAIAVIRPAP